MWIMVVLVVMSFTLSNGTNIEIEFPDYPEYVSAIEIMDEVIEDSDENNSIRIFVDDFLLQQLTGIQLSRGLSTDETERQQKLWINCGHIINAHSGKIINYTDAEMRAMFLSFANCGESVLGEKQPPWWIASFVIPLIVGFFYWLIRNIKT